MKSVVVITVESSTMNAEKLRDFVERHLSLNTKANKEGKQITVHIETQEWK